MNQHRPQCPGDLAIATADDARLNYHWRDIVEHAIQMQAASNTMSAFEYLRTRDVDPRVIERVLLEPGRRRSSA
ncbi:hypothetical protein [Massilia horti]|uniref:Uncharacterized protein n=1 Tax=Massilia horti TaxID=2562153 RepID=A0A4Y9T9S2_9BURK|nr:hypothetical protein [Massilia horti]TFW34836.1 hypothetical protein E4O92_03095 [Massilia horti]